MAEVGFIADGSALNQEFRFSLNLASPVRTAALQQMQP